MTKPAANRPRTPTRGPLARLVRRYRYLLREMISFIIVGVLNTVVFFLVYNVLRSYLSPFQANAVGVTIGAIANFYANRRFTFRITGTDGLGLQLVQFAVAFGLTLFLSTAALDILYRIDADPSRLAENIALLMGTAVVIVLRFLLLRMWVFNDARRAVRSTGSKPPAA